MATLTIDGNLYKKLVANGCQSLINDIDRVNALNVFPVPDGDTGTNMRMTIEGGVKASESMDQPSIGIMSKDMARAMTMSARGNSGVILSQFFKGLSLGFAGKDEVDALGLLEAFEAAVKQSYKVVQKPTEGTILTVMREATEVARANAESFASIEDFFRCYIKEAYASLERTPDLLPCLKEAGVIDSGGAGFNRIIEGMISVLDGNILIEEQVGLQQAKMALKMQGYNIETIVKLTNVENYNEGMFADFLGMFGKFVDLSLARDALKVSIQTQNPGKVISFLQKHGDFISFHMDNLGYSEAEKEAIVASTQRQFQKYTVVAVSSGEGISEAFTSMGCDEIVSGGQTMNPSSEDFITAFDKLNTEVIFVFPNNGNIIMAARQAAECYDKAKVVVIPTKSIAACYSALTMLDYSSDDVDSIVEGFNATIENVTAASVTYSIRDASIDGVEIKKDDYMAIVNGKIVASTASKVEVVKQLFASVEDMDDKEVITLIYGNDVTDEEKQEIVSFLNSTYRFAEVGEIEGQQDVYSFIIAIE